LGASKRGHQEQWTKFMIYMGKTKFKKITPDSRGSLTLLSKFHVFSTLQNWGKKSWLVAYATFPTMKRTLSNGIWCIPHEKV
jgi:hypothetical protein